MTGTSRLPEHHYNNLFQRIQAETPGLTLEQAAMLLCVALAAGNDPDGVAIVTNLHLNTMASVTKQVAWIEYLRHALCKACLLCSFPRSWNATNAVMNSLSPDIKGQLRLDPINTPSGPEEAHQWHRRGSDFFKDVYRSRGVTIEANIKNASPDLWAFVEYGYGNIVSDMTYMTAVDTELSVIVNLYTMDGGPQFVDHLKGVLNVGGSEQQAQSALHIARLLKESSFHIPHHPS
ncbi:hypothetical protein BDA99DRAFT_540111 [Phascolomyces articulosus]|uniref:Uncharacterized protein n=1 Tax=Phascolomyces articulosus TaxID=60185 RepID=A0AAD5PBI8_9FUNG|nr:hypothetical protein BDA99DRAFT_540111 [Phascolomyces articulosus]